MTSTLNELIQEYERQANYQLSFWNGEPRERHNLTHKILIEILYKLYEIEAKLK